MVILLICDRIVQSDFDFLLIATGGHLAEERDDLVFTVRENDVPPGEKFEKQVVKAIAEDDVDDSISPNLGNGGHPSRLEELAQATHEAGGRARGGARILGEMTSKTGVDNELFAMVRFGEFEEEDALVKRGQVSDRKPSKRKFTRDVLTEERS